MFPTYLAYIYLVYPILAVLKLISTLYFTSTKNKISLLDPPLNENSDVSCTPHKTVENTTTYLAFTKNFHLK